MTERYSYNLKFLNEEIDGLIRATSKRVCEEFEEDARAAERGQNFKLRPLNWDERYLTRLIASRDRLQNVKDA